MDTLPPGTQIPSIGSMSRPEYWPSVSKLQIDSEKRIWVYGYPRLEGGLRPYQALSMSGKVVKTGMLDRIPKLIQKSKIYFMSSEKNEDSKVFLEVFELELD